MTLDQPIPEPVLVARGISKKFGGVAALNDVSVEIRPGEVHCLVGENGSGKSTLIKVFSGVESPDSGTISVGGADHRQLTPRQAIAAGIEVIFQDFSLFPNLSVAENIAIAPRISERRWTVRPAALRSVARDVVNRVGVDLDLDARVETLSVADKQLTAICRALAERHRVVFLDEPTTALTWREVDVLFGILDVLKGQGVGVVFVSHKIEEVLRIAQWITVLRNGSVVASGPAAQCDRGRLVEAMTGRTVALSTPGESPSARSVPSLEVEDLGRKGSFEGVSFAIKPGEVVGLTGLLGSGRTEIAEALFGIEPADHGVVRVDGRAIRLESVQDAMAAGIGYVPADRLTQGGFLDQSIARNIIASSLDRLVGRLNLLRPTAVEETVKHALEDLEIRASSPEAVMRSLSGGNQQRVVLAKWLARRLRVLILNSPTVGVDIGSKATILEILRTKSMEGLAVLIISDDVPELMAISNRVIVVRRGRIAGELSGERLTEHEILKELAA